MLSIPHIVTALLLVASFAVADILVVADLEPAMIAVIPQNHQEQTLIFPHINPQASSAIDQERYEYVNSILSAVVPESELQEAQDNPGTFALIPLNERPWFDGLPADVKEYLAHMAKAEAKMAEFDITSAKVVGESSPKFRGKGWWWA